MPHRQLIARYGDQDLPVHRTTVLALMWGCTALLCALAFLMDRIPDSRTELLAVFCVPACVIAVVLWTYRRRWIPPLLVHVLVGAYSLGVAVLACGAVRDQSLSALGSAVIMACAYAGYFQPRRVLVVQLTWSLVSYTLGVWFSEAEAVWAAVTSVWCVSIGLGLSLHHLTGLLRQRYLNDPLTGAVARDAWLRMAEAAVRRGSTRPVTVAMIDLDDFKTINDTLGHRAGDDLLRDLSRTWSAALGHGAILGRYGGDEFVVLFARTARAEAEEWVERMRGAHPARWSCGLATADEPEEIAALLNRADDELRRAKSARTPTGPRGPRNPGTATVG